MWTKIKLLQNRLGSYLKRLPKCSVPVRNGLIYMALVGLLLITPGILQKIVVSVRNQSNHSQVEEEQIEATKQKLEGELKTLEKKLSKKLPKTPYLVINSADNEFSLYKGTVLMKKDKCSTGSYVLLKSGDSQEYMFKTPKGEFRIRGKVESPVWRKPDWAFVEEGIPVPPQGHSSRFEYGVLGDYALSLGDGYLIHGTLYQRFLGLPVTHGCIRLNDENLELVYKTLAVGSKVYIY